MRLVLQFVTDMLGLRYFYGYFTFSIFNYDYYKLNSHNLGLLYLFTKISLVFLLLVLAVLVLAVLVLVFLLPFYVFLKNHCIFSLPLVFSYS